MIRLLLLGPPDLLLADGAETPAILRAPKTVAFLSRLALGAPDFVRRAQLVGLLWPELDEARARNALSKTLHHARKALGDEAFVVRGHDEIGLAPESWAIDVWELEAALTRGEVEVALARHGRGALLEGLYVADAPAFDPWLDGVRERLRTRLLKGVLARADALEATSTPSDALAYLAHASELAPADEVLVRRRLRLLDQLGDRGGARQVYEQFVARLQRDLELHPSPETVALMTAIGERRAVSSPTGPEDRPAVSAAPPSPVVSRDTAAPAPAMEVPPAPAPTRGRRWGLPAAGLLTTAALVLVGVLATRPTRTPLTGVGRRVLVAPFANRTGDTAFRPLSEMVADFVAQGIQRADLLEVVDPLTSVLATANGPLTASDAERTLSAATRAGAGTVVSGAFYRRGDSLVFQAEVIDVDRRRRLAIADSVVTGTADVVAIATRVREATAGMLATIFDPRLASTGAGLAPTPSLAAYSEFRRGLELFPTKADAALPHFLAAAKLDTSFTQPLVWAAFVHGNQGRRDARDSIVRILAGRRERLRGLDRYAVEYMASSMEGRHADVLEAAKAAAAASPGSHWSHNASNQLLAQNRLASALTYLHQVDPEHGWAGPWFPYWKNLTNALHLQGQHEEELRQIRRARRLGSSPLLAGYEVRALIALDRVDEGERRLAELVRAGPPNEVTVSILRSTGEEMRTHGYRDAATRAFALGAELAANLQVHADRAADALPAWARVERAWTLYESERPDAAMLALDSLPERAIDSRDAASARFLRALIVAARGRDANTMRPLAVIDPDGQASRNDYERAQLAAAAGDRDGAVRLMRALLDGYLNPDMVIWLHRDHEWATLRAHPPFRALLVPR